MNNLRYIQYARKSTEAVERQVLSIPEQVQECKNTAVQAGLNVIVELQESKSAFKPEVRVAFDEMISMLKDGQADAILTWNPNRLTRNPQEGGILLQMLQDGLIKEIRAATGEVYTPESDLLVLHLHFGMSNEYSRKISKDVRRAMKYKVERGEYFRSAPTGYENYGDIKGKRNIKPKETEASIVAEMFELATTGNYSYKYLAKFMFERGVITSKGTPLANNSVAKMLRNPMYYGWFLYKGEIHKGDYDAIISKELFDKAQLVLGDRTRPKESTWNHTYNGIIKCGVCGCSISTSVKVKRYRKTRREARYTYHRCTHKRGDCSQPPVSTAQLEEMFWDYLSQIYIDEEVWALGIDLLKAKHGFQTQKDMEKILELQKRLADLRVEKAALIHLRANNEITSDELRDQKKVIVDQEVAIETRLKDWEQSNNDWLENAENFLNDVYRAKEIMNSLDLVEKKELITRIGSNLLLKDKKLTMTLRKPYDILLQPGMRTDWQG